MDNIVARLDNIDTVLTATENPVGSKDGYYGDEDWSYDGIVLEDYPGVEYGPAVSSHDCEDVKSVLEVKLGPSFKLKKNLNIQEHQSWIKAKISAMEHCVGHQVNGTFMPIEMVRQNLSYLTPFMTLGIFMMLLIGPILYLCDSFCKISRLS